LIQLYHNTSGWNYLTFIFFIYHFVQCLLSFCISYAILVLCNMLQKCSHHFLSFVCTSYVNIDIIIVQFVRRVNSSGVDLTLNCTYRLLHSFKCTQIDGRKSVKPISICIDVLLILGILKMILQIWWVLIISSFLWTGVKDFGKLTFKWIIKVHGVNDSMHR